MSQMHANVSWPDVASQVKVMTVALQRRAKGEGNDGRVAMKGGGGRRVCVARRMHT